MQVVELGYSGRARRGYYSPAVMPFPASYYQSLAVGVRAHYYLSMADGMYTTTMKADIEDVLLLTRWALGNVTILDVGEKAWRGQ